MADKQHECAVQNGAHFRTDNCAEEHSRGGWGEGKREEVGTEEEREDAEKKEEKKERRPKRAAR